MPEIRGNNKSLGEGIEFAITGRSWRSIGKTTKALAEEMMRNLGESTQRVSEAAGVSQRTVQKWLKGDQEANAKNRGSLEEAVRAMRIKPGRAALLAGSAQGAPPPPAEGEEAGPEGAPEGGEGAAPAGGGGGAGGPGGGGLRIYGTVVVSEDERERWVRPGSKIPEGALDEILEIYAREGHEAAGAALNRLISQHYVQGMKVTRVESIEYD
ncbi:hypothetical protein [Micrococcus luteus]|uniref:hypothetical protein n=1 Tax=Micrococcus luteus TaxID=1270 RepID=UPI003333384B